MSESHDIGQVFNELSKEYTDFMDRALPYYRTLIGFGKDIDQNNLPEQILDLGCGNGNVTAMLLPWAKKATFTLVDASREMLEQCEKRFLNREKFITVNTFFQDLELQPDSFDLVTAGLCLHHLKSAEKREIFSSIYKWLKPGGIFLYSDLMTDKYASDHEINMTRWEKKARSQGTTDAEWDYIIDHYKKYDFPDDYRKQMQWIKEAGFSEVKMAWQEDYWCKLKAVK